MGSYTHLQQRDSLGRRVIMVPDNAWALLLNYRFTDGTLKGLSAFVGTNYVGRVAGDIPSPAFTALGVPTQVSYYLPALQLWSCGGRYTWDKITFALNVDNAFDKKYIGLSSGRFLGGVGTPMNVRATISYKF
jgi:iron complex outermembrane receptor protein